MSDLYRHHRIETAPRCWRSVAEAIVAARPALEAAGGRLYGIWRSQIGRPRDELTAITHGPANADDTAWRGLLDGIADVGAHTDDVMSATLKPESPVPPRRQGNYAFRWFETPALHWNEFLALCTAAWPGFEAAYDSQIVGLWRLAEDGPGGTRRSMLLTRRPDLAMWERSKIPATPAEQAVRDRLSRRYDLCEATWVYTTTLLTAEDRDDAVRWT